MAGVTFGQLPDEEPAFLAYLQKSGDVWARAVADSPVSPKHEPLPVAEFLARFASEILEYHVVDTYLGFREDVLHPVLTEIEVVEGGTSVPRVESGNVVPGVSTIVGGTKVRRPFIDYRASHLMRYKRGMFLSDDELEQSNLGYQTGSPVRKLATFLTWAKNVLGWMRRHTPESVPVFRCNYEIQATKGVAEACRRGLKLR
jgi:hypothetical protein